MLEYTFTLIPVTQTYWPQWQKREMHSGDKNKIKLCRNHPGNRATWEDKKKQSQTLRRGIFLFYLHRIQLFTVYNNVIRKLALQPCSPSWRKIHSSNDKLSVHKQNNMGRKWLLLVSSFHQKSQGTAPKEKPGWKSGFNAARLKGHKDRK